MTAKRSHPVSFEGNSKTYDFRHLQSDPKNSELITFLTKLFQEVDSTELGVLIANLQQVKTMILHS